MLWVNEEETLSFAQENLEWWPAFIQEGRKKGTPQKEYMRHVLESPNPGFQSPL